MTTTPPESSIPPPPSPTLSGFQLRTLAGLGEERTAEVGEVLYGVGDRSYPFIAILEGEAAILDAAGNEIVRHGASGFSRRVEPALRTDGVRERGRYPAHAVHRGRPRGDALAPVRGRAPGRCRAVALIARREALQTVPGLGLEIVGPRSSPNTRAMVEFARRNRVPFTWRDSDSAGDPSAAGQVAGLDAESLPLVRLPGGLDLQGPSTGQVSGALGYRPRAGAAPGSRPPGGGCRSRRARRGCLWRFGGARHPRHRQHIAWWAGRGPLAGSRLSRLSGRNHRQRTDQPRGHPGAQVQRTAGHPVPGAVARSRQRTPHRAPGRGSPDRRASCPAGDRRAVPPPSCRELDQYEGISVFYAAGPPEAQLCGAARVGVVGGGNSAGQAAVWLARGGALVTLLHRRADLRETMSEYLVGELEQYGVPVRDRSEIATLHGTDGHSKASR